MSTLLFLAGLEYRHAGSQSRFELFVPSFTVRRQDRVALSGPSGSGKSTLLDTLAFILKPASVESWWVEDRGAREDIGSIYESRNDKRLLSIRSRFLGYVLQAGGLLPFLSVRANIELPRKLLGLPKDETVPRLAVRLGIEPQLDKRPSQLSIGERQRVAIARAVAHNPALVLADEPTAALDHENADNVMRILVQLSEELDTALVVASHDRHLLERFGFVQAKFTVEASSATRPARSVFAN